jgi:putative nucleotidyltransferase with HDIG domain
VVNRAGIFGAPAQALVERIVAGRRPSFRFDQAETDQRLEEAEAKVQPVMTPYHVGDTIYRAGETLTKQQAALAALEHEHFVASQATSRLALTALGILGVVVLVTAAVGGYLRVSYRRQLGRPWRVGAIAGMSLALLGVSGWGAIAYPNLTWFATLTPAIFLAMLLVIAYDRRIAMMVTIAQAVLVGIELNLSVGFVAAVLIGAMLTGWRLASVRNRNDMVWGGLVVSAGLVLAVATVGLVERPWGLGVLPEILADALSVGIGGFLAAAITLVMLPGVERVFDVVTGMTLSELRDPKQPLLRKLQQSAPGTYNHSLNVATLAESAADAIGADGLHAYVGALYHDIGKMNKPDYFVENQPRGFNRHEKLSPAMSLLVIVGHVKDGMELAREYNLPRSLHHYIESHHGTTLVEYFYDQAKRQADADESTDRPAEIEYRYPGPKPRTKEAAILMLCDAVESATRAMAEPTPSRIQQLVHALARKRLMDGQFDESNVTLRDLSIIEDALTKSLCAIYHGRIAYPKAEPAKDAEEEMASAADRVAAEQGA